MNQHYSSTGGYFSQANCPPCNQVSNCPPCKPCRVELPAPDVQEIPTESQLIYIPYSRKVIEHVTQEKVERIPVEKVITEYEEVKVYEQVPIEKKIISYYAVEKVIDYSVDYKPNTYTDYVDKEIVSHEVEYVPFERQIIHYPTESINGSTGGSSYGFGGSTGGYNATAVHAGTTGGYTAAGGSGLNYSGAGQYAPTATTGSYIVSGSQYAQGGQYPAGGQFATSGGQYATSGGQYATGGSGSITASGRPYEMAYSNYIGPEGDMTGGARLAGGRTMGGATGGVSGGYGGAGFYQELSSSIPGQNTMKQSTSTNQQSTFNRF